MRTKIEETALVLAKTRSSWQLVDMNSRLVYLAGTIELRRTLALTPSLSSQGEGDAFEHFRILTDQ
jgi:hypothetical protein